MTTVRELIKDSTFTVADKFKELKPEVTILLPTYSRGNSGFLKRAIDSVLDQTFTNFECFSTEVYLPTEWEKAFSEKTVPSFCELYSRVSIPAINIAEAFICTLFYYLSGKKLFKSPIKFDKKFFLIKLKTQQRK